MAAIYLQTYFVRHKAATFANYAAGHVIFFFGCSVNPATPSEPDCIAKSVKTSSQAARWEGYLPDEKDALLAAAKEARSPAIYPALMLAPNASMRDAEIRGLQWERVDLSKAILTVGESKTEAGEGALFP